MLVLCSNTFCLALSTFRGFVISVGLGDVESVEVFVLSYAGLGKVCTAICRFLDCGEPERIPWKSCDYDEVLYTVWTWHGDL